VLHYVVVGAPAADIEMVCQATRRLLRSTDALTDEEVAQPSLLPGWSRAELLTHLARNADGLRRLSDAAANGEVADMYPGGPRQRAADIAAGRGEPAQPVVQDLRRASDELERSWRKLADDGWAAIGRVAGGESSMRETVQLRLREIEVHHVDLDVGYTPSDWPVGFVAAALDDALTTLPARESRGRPDVDARYRVEATDHGRTWTVTLDGAQVAVAAGEPADADAVVSGWGCDLLAWLYGRDTSGDVLTTSGADRSVLQLPTWFPYP
jgi:maleylpyruvate isomerase